MILALRSSSEERLTDEVNSLVDRFRELRSPTSGKPGAGFEKDNLLYVTYKLGAAEALRIERGAMRLGSGTPGR